MRDWLNHDSLDVAFRCCRDPADRFGNERSCASDLPDHRSSLHRVEIHGVAVDGWGRRLKLRDAERDEDDDQEGRYAIESLAHAFLPGQVRPRNIHR